MKIEQLSSPQAANPTPPEPRPSELCAAFCELLESSQRHLEPLQRWLSGEVSPLLRQWQDSSATESGAHEKLTTALSSCSAQLSALQETLEPLPECLRKVDSKLDRNWTEAQEARAERQKQTAEMEVLRRENARIIGENAEIKRRCRNLSSQLEELNAAGR